MSERAGRSDRLEELRRDPRLIGALVGLVAIAGGVAWWRSSDARPPGASSATPVTGSGGDTHASSTTAATVYVHVVGAVRAPGVVQLPSDARVVDAIAAVGGAADDADLQQVNLAARVADGQRIAVPRAGEVLPPEAAGGAPSDGAAAGPLNLNAATAAQLEELPGIGPALAEAIVRERERMGGFRTIDDLQRVRGIGPARFEQLRDLVTV